MRAEVGLILLGSVLSMTIRPWKVRPASPSDAEAAHRLLLRSYSTLLPNDYSPEVLEVVLPIITKPSEELLTCGTWYLVEHPDEPSELIGCGGWTRRRPGRPRTAENDATVHLRHFATDPDWTRQGIARAIWQRIRNDLADQQHQQDPPMEVYSTRTGVPFYKSLGFQVMDDDITIAMGTISFPVVGMLRQQEDHRG